MTGAPPRSSACEPRPVLPPRGQPVAMCFSGGKDSALALREIQQQQIFTVTELLTTVTDAYDRVSMHGVRRTLLREQAASLGVRLTEVTVPPNAFNAAYELAMGSAFARLHLGGIRQVVFGDIFLADLRSYREQQLGALDLECLFPLWKRDTADLARQFVQDGFRAVVVCVNPKVLAPSFAGRAFDEAFLVDLPPDVDPCGENGEFHTCVFDGPIFEWPIAASPGMVVERDGFVFCDLISLGRDDQSRGAHRGGTPC